MKSKNFCLLHRVSSILLLTVATALRATACGPYFPIIPTPVFFTSRHGGDPYRQENLRLWQQLTSARIPFRDIEQAVYEDSRDEADRQLTDSHPQGDNLLYVYLRNRMDVELSCFLLTAKALEEQIASLQSPWYYPASRDSVEAIDGLQDIIGQCKDYRGTRLRDRYALQAVRALFFSRQYDQCIDYYEATLYHYPDTNLFKRMGLGYVAGCRARLGYTEKANAYFAQCGDLHSLRTENPVAYMAEHNPDCVALMEHLQTLAQDSARLCAVQPIAEDVLRSHRAKNRGDWEFLLAYIEGEHHADYPKASSLIRAALGHRFSSDDLRDHARAYQIKVDAAQGKVPLRVEDLKWMESKTDVLAADAKAWSRMLRHIVYTDWVPKLWHQKDYATAILLCRYADNLDRRLPTTWIDTASVYGSLSFQLMYALSSAQLIQANRSMAADTPLYTYLRKHTHTDADCIHELVGTLALREGNYRRAVQYLSTVSAGYLQSMPVYTEGYLKRDPFCGALSTKLLASPYTKHRFAQKMLRLQQQMKYGKSADARGLARLQYAIGRRNSLSTCWALTQYRKGDCLPTMFVPCLQYWDDDFAAYDDILYNVEDEARKQRTEDIYRQEVKRAMAMLRSDEAKAEAEYLLYNLRTIVKRYGHTTVARRVRHSCDNWRSWL